MSADAAGNEPLARLTVIFQEVFDDDEIPVSRATTARDVPGWDSLRHVSLLVSVERAFGVRFKSSEVANLKNVGELLDLIALHRGRSPSRCWPRRSGSWASGRGRLRTLAIRPI